MTTTTEPAAQPAPEASSLRLDETAVAVGPMQWVPVADHLPDDDQAVLICMEDCEVWTGFHADDRWFYVSADPVGSPVTHWMEFPGPPVNDRVEGRDAASSRRVPSHDGLCGNGSEVGAGDTAKG